MTYAVKEAFLTLQGEGVQAGRRAVFLRFAGCNLWSGREADRATAVCQFCDTQFVGTDGVGGGKFADADALADRVAGLWGEGADDRFVVITGGEPMLQLDSALTEILSLRGRQFDPKLTDLFLGLVARLRREHVDLDAFLGEAADASPFLQARKKIKETLLQTADCADQGAESRLDLQR